MIGTLVEKLYIIFLSGFLSGFFFSFVMSLFFLLSVRKVSPAPRKIAKIVVIFLIFLAFSLVIGPFFSFIYGIFFFHKFGGDGSLIYFIVVFAGIAVLSNLIVYFRKIKDLKIIIFLNFISGLTFSILPPIFFKIFTAG